LVFPRFFQKGISSVGFAELSDIPFCEVSDLTYMSSDRTDWGGAEIGIFAQRIGGAMCLFFYVIGSLV